MQPTNDKTLRAARTPSASIARLNRKFPAALVTTDLRDKRLNRDLKPLHSTPEEFRAYLKEKIVKWAKVARDSGARVE